MLNGWALAFVLGASSGIILPITVTALVTAISNRLWRSPEPPTKEEIAEVVRQVLHEQKNQSHDKQ